ncbi:hypothetical protein OF001_U190052 [Pseudomonas sp. OF001]|nr:hypothetical protein OF001_U190052 [Pseudomonas sp. OF001]
MRYAIGAGECIVTGYNRLKAGLPYYICNALVLSGYINISWPNSSGGELCHPKDHRFTQKLYQRLTRVASGTVSGWD